MPHQALPRITTETVALAIEHVGKPVRYAHDKRSASALVKLFYDDTNRKSLVVMADGNNGASITNAADAIAGFLLRLHLSRKGYPARWIYADSTANWDEINVVAAGDIGLPTVTFSPLGLRQKADAVAAIRGFGVQIDVAIEEVNLLTSTFDLAA